MSLNAERVRSLLGARDGWLHSRLWIAAAVTLIVVLHLVGLTAAPPGLYNDEASIGYNAWAIAHGGTDEHGAHFPLFFQAFGDYKSPVYIYTLAPFTTVFPIGVGLVRLPAALSGIAIALAAGELARRLSASRVVVAVVITCVGLEPWLWSESRVAFEPIEMVLLLVLALVALARRPVPRGREFVVAGSVIALSAYTYSSARLFGAIFGVIIVMVYGLGGRRRRAPRWWLVLPPLTAGYVGLLAYQVLRPNVLLARYTELRIGADGAPIPVVLARVAINYVQYLSPSFLFTRGDGYLRHSSGIAGMLTVAIAPVLLMGLVGLARRRRSDPFARMVILGLVASPLPAALASRDTPHSLRASTMLPFLIATLVVGWMELAPLLAARRAAAVAGAIAVTACYGNYLLDYAFAYPARAVRAFDTGEATAVSRAHALASGHHILISKSFDQPYIQAIFVLLPDAKLYAAHGLSTISTQVGSPPDLEARAEPGDVLVLAATDPAPSRAHKVDTVSYIVDRATYDPGVPEHSTLVLATLWAVGR